jgi:hypothetical protein
VTKSTIYEVGDHIRSCVFPLYRTAKTLPSRFGLFLAVVNESSYKHYLYSSIKSRASSRKSSSDCPFVIDCAHEFQNGTHSREAHQLLQRKGASCEAPIQHAKAILCCLFIYSGMFLEFAWDCKSNLLGHPRRLAAALAHAPERHRLIAIADHPAMASFVLVQFWIRIGEA